MPAARPSRSSRARSAPSRRCSPKASGPIRPFDDLLSTVVGQVAALTGAAGACVALMDEGHLVIRAAHGIPAMIAAIGHGSARSGDAMIHVLRDLVEMPVEAVELRVGTELAGVLAAAGETTSEFGARAVTQAVASQLALALVIERARATASCARCRPRARACDRRGIPPGDPGPGGRAGADRP